EGLGLTVREGLVTGSAGTVTSRIEANVTPSLSEATAIAAALSAAPREVPFAGTGHQCELSLDLSVEPGRGGAREPVLSYLCALEAEDPSPRYLAAVDATPGAVTDIRPEILFNDGEHVLAPATVQTGWHGARQVQVHRHVPTNTYSLERDTIVVL